MTADTRTANPRRVRLAAVFAAVPLFMGVSAVAAPAASATALYYPGSASSGSSTSQDWAGWDVTGDTYTSVGASWTVPAVTCTTGETSYSADWVGLDGDGSESVEQIGTSSDCDAGTASYSSWYEFYPQASVSVRNVIKAGDKMTASVKSDGDGGYTLTLKDATENWTVTKTGSVPEAQNASAEIIAEAPSSSRTESVLPLANFASTSFSAVSVNGKALSTMSGARSIDMADRYGTEKATTSALTGTGDFSVTWKSSGSTTSAGQGTGTGGGGPGAGVGPTGIDPGSDTTGTGSGSTGSTGTTGSEGNTTAVWVLTRRGWVLVAIPTSDASAASGTATDQDSADPARDWATELPLSASDRRALRSTDKTQWSDQGADVPEVSTRRIVSLAASAFVVLAAEPLFLLVDTAVVGHLGAVPLAALAAGGAFMSLLALVGASLEYGTTGRAARFFGAGRRGDAVNEGVQASWLALLLGFAAMLAGEVFAGPVVRALVGPGPVTDAAQSWLRIAILGLPAVLLVQAGNGWLRGVQETRTPVRIVTIANVLSLIASPLLVFPVGLGLIGSAIANVVAQWVGAGLCLRALVVERVSLRPHRGVMGKQMVVSRDLVLRSVAFQAAFLTAAGVAGRMG